MVLACITPYCITSGSRLNAAISTGAAVYMVIPISSAMEMEQRIPNFAPFFALSYCFAPRFCPTKVVIAIVKQVTGRKAKPSTLE